MLKTMLQTMLKTALQAKSTATATAPAGAAIALCLLAGASNAQELNSSWEMHISDLQHALKAEATVQFTDENVSSCMRGKWKRLAVNAKDGTNTTFFPLTEPMAYKVEHGVLTLARTKVCNPYILLTGISSAQDIHGTYKAVSIGRSINRGYFSLRDITAPASGNGAPRSAGLMASVAPARKGN